MRASTSKNINIFHFLLLTPSSGCRVKSKMRNLPVGAFLLEPVQRITRYPLLLKVIQNLASNIKLKCSIHHFIFEILNHLLKNKAFCDSVSKLFT